MWRRLLLSRWLQVGWSANVEVSWAPFSASSSRSTNGLMGRNVNFAHTLMKTGLSVDVVISVGLNLLLAHSTSPFEHRID
jgi:hypothetical protein